eukprot:59639-Amphidinium_carterae.3
MGVRRGELSSSAEFNHKWIEQHFSNECQIEAKIYLRIWDEWTNIYISAGISSNSDRCEWARAWRSRKASNVCE